MRDWNIDYETVAQVNKNLVAISITPFGQTGPYSGWNAYDLNAPFPVRVAGIVVAR